MKCLVSIPFSKRSSKIEKHINALVAHLGYSAKLAQMKRGASVPHRASLTALGASSALLGVAHESSAGPATPEGTSHFLVRGSEHI